MEFCIARSTDNEDICDKLAVTCYDRDCFNGLTKEADILRLQCYDFFKRTFLAASGAHRKQEK